MENWIWVFANKIPKLEISDCWEKLNAYLPLMLGFFFLKGYRGIAAAPNGSTSSEYRLNKITLSSPVEEVIKDPDPVEPIRNTDSPRGGLRDFKETYGG